MTLKRCLEEIIGKPENEVIHKTEIGQDGQLQIVESGKMYDMGYIAAVVVFCIFLVTCCNVLLVCIKKWRDKVAVGK